MLSSLVYFRVLSIEILFARSLPSAARASSSGLDKIILPSETLHEWLTYHSFLDRWTLQETWCCGHSALVEAGYVVYSR